MPSTNFYVSEKGSVESVFLPKIFQEMKEVTYEEYLEYIKYNNETVIGGTKIPLKIGKINGLQPKNFSLEQTTVWSFPKRGDWATHKYNARYRGNWAPQIPRNLILRYTKEGEIVLDPFMGSGTTIIECKLLNRRCVGVDVNFESVMTSWSRLDFEVEGKPPYYNIKLFHGDARNLNLINDEEVDAIITHPPYAGIIRYTKKGTHPDDLSNNRNIDDFIQQMMFVAKEFWRVLKTNGHLAIMIGDTRIHKHYIPISYRVLQVFLEAGFILREHIIKVQHNMKGTIKWIGKNKDFLLIKHENIFVFRKPTAKEYKKYKYSSKWW